MKPSTNLDTLYPLLPALREFFFKHGHVQVPQDNEELYCFIRQLRDTRLLLSKEMVEELDMLGFLWHESTWLEIQWLEKYEKVKEYYQKNGHTRIPGKFDGRLKNWVNYQRKRENALLAWQKKLLDAIGFPWSSTIKQEAEEHWMKMFRKLKEFYEKNGHSRVPKSNKKLYFWSKKIRDSGRKLPVEKAELLKSVNLRLKGDYQREKLRYRKKMFRQIQAFYQKYGDTRFQLHGQKSLVGFMQEVKLRPHLLTKEERKILKACKYEFSVEKRRMNMWFSWIERLKQYKAGKSSFDELYKDDFNLHHWMLGTLRQIKKLTPNQQKAVLALGPYQPFSNRIEKKWMAMYQNLLTFKDSHGHVNVPHSYHDKKLVYWTDKQRKNWNKISEAHKQLLRKIGFDLQPRKTLIMGRWLKQYNKLIEFKGVNGHTNVPPKYGDKKLAGWVNRQRALQFEMPEGRKRLLNKIGFNWGKRKRPGSNRE